jgi:hypothetical protein
LTTSTVRSDSSAAASMQRSGTGTRSCSATMPGTSAKAPVLPALTDSELKAMARVSRASASVSRCGSDWAMA